MTSPTDGEIGRLQRLDTPALRELWTRAFTRPPPKRVSRDLLLRAVTYQMQEQAEGSLSKSALKRLAAVALQDPPSDSAATKLKPGTRLIREWRGQVHQVTVCEHGFDYRGARHTSLSHIAREITGARWSGPLFFGLRKRTTQSKETSNDP